MEDFEIQKEFIKITEDEPCTSIESDRLIVAQEAEKDTQNAETANVDYSHMNDIQLEDHLSDILLEVSRRDDLKESVATNVVLKNRKLYSLVKSIYKQCEKEDCYGFRNPNDDYVDAHDYILSHEDHQAITYDHDNGSYCWNPLPVPTEFLNMDFARKVNELNGLTIENGEVVRRSKRRKVAQEVETPQVDNSRSRTPIGANAKMTQKYWSNKGGDPPVDAHCSKCKQKFTSIRSLLDHRLSAHSMEDMLQCGICGKKCQLRTHIYLHLSYEYKIYQCDICHAHFPSTYHASKHRESCAVKRGVENIKPEPGKGSQAANTRTNPSRNKTKRSATGTRVSSPTPPKPASLNNNFDCPKCGKTYLSSYWLSRHEDQCNEGVAPPLEDVYHCDNCNRSYYTLHWYNKHREKCLQDSMPKETKSRSLDRSKSNDVTTPIATKSVKPKHQAPCPNCSKLYVTKEWLDKHLLTCKPKIKTNEHSTSTSSRHSLIDDDSASEMMDGIKQEEDDGMLLSEADIKQEVDMDDNFVVNTDDVVVKTEVEDDEVVAIKCSLCDVVCHTVADILYHRDKKHGKKAMLTCTKCDRQCNSVSTIRRHLNVEYRIFQCKTCFKNCVDRPTLQTHICNVFTECKVKQSSQSVKQPIQPNPMRPHSKRQAFSNSYVMKNYHDEDVKEEVDETVDDTTNDTQHFTRRISRLTPNHSYKV